MKKKTKNKKQAGKPKVLEEIEQIQYQLRNFAYEFLQENILRLTDENIKDYYDNPETEVEAIRAVLIEKTKDYTIIQQKLFFICDKLFDLYYKK